VYEDGKYFKWIWKLSIDTKTVLLSTRESIALIVNYKLTLVILLIYIIYVCISIIFCLYNLKFNYLKNDFFIHTIKYNLNNTSVCDNTLEILVYKFVWELTI